MVRYIIAFRGEHFGWGRYGRLTVLSKARKNSNDIWIYLCKCDCGNICEAPTNLLKTGQKVSCGCKNEGNKLSAKSFDKGLIDGTMISAIKELRRKNKNNSSDFTGVHYDSKKNKWVAQITFQRINHNLGRLDFKEDAIKARLDAKKVYFEKYIK